MTDLSWYYTCEHDVMSLILSDLNTFMHILDYELKSFLIIIPKNKE